MTYSHAADGVERRRHGRTGALGMWPVGSRELCRPRTEAEGKLVTESDLSLRAPAQVAAVRYSWHQLGGYRLKAFIAIILRVPGPPQSAVAALMTSAGVEDCSGPGSAAI